MYAPGSWGEISRNDENAGSNFTEVDRSFTNVNRNYMNGGD